MDGFTLPSPYSTNNTQPPNFITNISLSPTTIWTHTQCDQSRNLAISKIRLRLRACTRSEELTSVLSLLEKFESLYADLPTTKNQINDMDVDTLERKVHTICTIREDIKSKYLDTENVDICKT